MKLDIQDYTPSLRWRQAEYQSLLFLPEDRKDRICPLVTIPPLEFDFELGVPKKTPHQHVHPFATRLKKKWGTRPCWVDLHPTLREALMDDGRVTYQYVFDGLRDDRATAIPVASLDMPLATLKVIGDIVSKDQLGLGLRLTLVDLIHPDKVARSLAVMNAVGCDISETDLLVDIEAPNYDPLVPFVNALISQLRAFPILEQFRNFALIGTGFPESMAGIATGASSIPRNHWIFYKSLIGSLTSVGRLPNFGDYTITHPGFVAMDMRMVKPAGKVIYATDNYWHVEKGGSFRDNRDQMYDHCDAIVLLSEFKGSSYSFGDHYITQCAARSEGTSNLTRWKHVGISHHMTVVLDDLASFHAGAWPS